MEYGIVTIGVRGWGARGAARGGGGNAWNSGNKQRDKKENKPKSLVNITFKTNYINRKSIGNILNFRFLSPAIIMFNPSI